MANGVADKKELTFIAAAALAVLFVSVCLDTVLFHADAPLESLLLKTGAHELFMRGWMLAMAAVLAYALYKLGRVRKLEKALHFSRSHFETAFRTSPDSININRMSDGLYIDVNEGFTNLTGYTREDVIGKSSVEIQIWNDLKDRERLVQALGKNREMKNLEAVFRMKDGSLKTALMSARIIMIDEVPHILSVTRDISELKAANEEVRKGKERYKRIFENIQDVYYEAEIFGNILEASPSVKTILGYEREELIGKSPLLTYGDPAQRERMIKQLLEGGHVKDFVLLLKHRSGELRHYSANLTLAYAAEGAPSHYFGSLRDIEENVRMQKSRAQSEAKYRELVQHANSIILKTDPGGRVTFLNEFGQSFFGITEKEMLGQNAVGYLVPQNGGTSGKNGKHSGNAAFSGDVTEKTMKDGSTAYVAWTKTAEEGGSGEVTGYLWVGNDITELKKTEQRLLLAENQLAQAQKMEALGTLASGIAHDFNNILQAIAGYGEILLADTNLSDEAKNNLVRIISGADRAQDLVRGLLALARKDKPQKRTLSVNREVEEILKLVSSTFPKNIEVGLDLQKDLWNIEADTRQIEQVVLNLCTNARDAIRERGAINIRTRNVELDETFYETNREASPGKWVCMEVSDTGYGIKSENLNKIFEPFFTTKGMEKGTGLGLSVVHGIVKAHGGFITCSSIEGIGTTFGIYFPSSGGISSADGSAPTVSEEIALSKGNETVLIVDDEESLRTLASAALKSKGYAVKTASSGEEAVRTFMKMPREISLVMLDLGMPGMGGHRCMEELLQIAPDAKIMVLSGYSEEDHGSRTMSAGAKRFITKPYSLTEMLKAVRETIDAN